MEPPLTVQGAPAGQETRPAGRHPNEKSRTSFSTIRSPGRIFPKSRWLWVVVSSLTTSPNTLSFTFLLLVFLPGGGRANGAR